MAIEKKLIHFGKLADFETQLNAGNILDYSIVFIQDAKMIWTHGTYYDCSGGSDVDLSDYLTSDEIAEVYATIDSLAAVATSGSYEDLTDKPTIPSEVTESTVSGWGFTKNTGTYSKPSDGIPKSDLASAVQTSLGKADTALQSYTEQYQGTITGIKMNGASKGTSGVVDLGTVITAHQDISGKQDKLVSGTNIKTINGTSILGSGNIVIEGGSGSSSGGSSAYSEVSHGTSDTTFELTPNTFHVWDEVAELSLTFGSETSGVANEYLFQFTSGSTATTLTLPDDIKWANDSAPTIAENMIYQISVLKGLASVLEFSNAAELIENKITLSFGSTQYILSSQYPVASELTINVSTPDGNVNSILQQGESTKSFSGLGPMIDTSSYIVNIIPGADSTYAYTF